MADNDAVARPPSPALSVDTPALEWLFAEPVTPSITTPTVASKPQFNCAICKKQHPLRFCRRFKSMDLEHRLRAVVKHRYCMRCLSASHISSKCLSNLKCAKCTDSHHFMLHDDDASRNRSKRRPKPRPLELTTASLRNSVRPVNQRAPSSNVVFPTCQLIIWIQGRPTKVRALLDQCSGMNYILQEFAVSRHFIQMPASDGQDVELVVSPTIDTTNRMRIVARVTNKMLRPTTSLSCPPSVRDHFKNLHLADPEFDQPGPLHMVLGMPVYNKVMKLNLLSQPGFPQAQDSIFGWVLSGICSM